MFGLAALRRAARSRHSFQQALASCWPSQQQSQHHAGFQTSSSGSSSAGKEPETPLLQTIRQRIMVCRITTVYVMVLQ
jgi:hypothetical protein